jgi:hypothetical protein
MRTVVLLPLVLLSLLAQGQSGVTISFGANSVTASGITPGKSAVFFASGLVPDDEQQRVIHYQQIVADDDRDGRVTVTLSEPVPAVTVWAVVDLTDARYAFGSPNGSYGRIVSPIPHGAFRRSAQSSAVDLFGLAHPVLDILYVHPGVGAWTWIAVDGRGLDPGPADGITRVAVGDARAVGDAHDKPPNEFVPGGLLVAIDWYHMSVVAARLDSALLGAGQ